VEAMGAFASIVIALFLFQSKQERYSENYFLLAMGFLTMGLLDGLHAVTEPGHGFVLLQSIASLAGGFWFALVWLPHSTVNRIESWNKWFPLSVTAGCVLFGIWTLLFKEALPLMVENGKFTPTAVAINSLSGVFFLTAAGRLLLEFRRFDKSETYLFACMSLLFGLSGLVIPHSQIWCPHWWWWHLLRLSAYLLAIGLVTYWYLQTVSALRVSITERKQTEKALQESEKTYRQLIENLQEGIWVIDKDAYTTFVNPPMAEMLGYTVDEMLGKHLFSFMDERGVEIAKQKLEQRKQSIKERHDFEFIRKDGKRIFTTLETGPLFDSNGNYIGAIAGVMDITERKQAEEALRNEKAFTESALNNLRDIFFVFDFEGRFLRWNETMTAVSGYSDNEISAMKPTDFFSVEDAKRIAEAIEIVVKEGSGSIETTVITKDGRHIPYEYIASLLKNKEGKPVGICGSGRDITERKRTEKEMESLRRQYELILNSAGEGIFGIDIQGNHTFVNPAAAKMLGYEVEELLGKHSHSIWHHTKADGSLYPEEECPIYATFKNSGVHYIRDEIFWKKDGTSFPVGYTSTPIVEDGKLVGAVVTFRDITERKQMEKAIREARDYLEMLFNYANAPIVVWDPSFRITRFNHAFEHLSGYTAEEVIGKQLHMLFPEASREDSLNEIVRTSIGEYWESVEIPILRKDGNVRIALWNSASIYAEDEKTILATIAQGHDFTERKRAEERIQSQLQHLKALCDIDRAITSSLDLRLTLKVVLQEVTNQLQVSAADILLLNPHMQTLEYAAGLGFRTTTL
jgi:PAS domain S-box-containing protein